MSCYVTRSMRGTECWTDHRLCQNYTVRLQIQPLARRQKPKKN